MKKILIFIGIATIALSLISGILTEDLFAFFVTFISGAVSSVVYFALLKVLENQEELMAEIRMLRAQTKVETKECEHCGKSYDAQNSTCPNCGRKNK